MLFVAARVGNETAETEPRLD